MEALNDIFGKILTGAKNLKAVDRKNLPPPNEKQKLALACLEHVDLSLLSAEEKQKLSTDSHIPLHMFETFQAGRARARERERMYGGKHERS